MTVLEKVEALKRMQDCAVDIKDRLEETVKSTCSFKCGAASGLERQGEFH